MRAWKVCKVGLVAIGLFTSGYTASDLIVGEGFNNNVLTNWPNNIKGNFDNVPWSNGFEGCSTEFYQDEKRSYLDCPFTLEGKKVKAVGDAYYGVVQVQNTNQRVLNAIVGGGLILAAGLGNAIGTLFFRKKSVDAKTQPSNNKKALDAKHGEAIQPLLPPASEFPAP